MREDAIVYSSGYVTNLATISTFVGRGDWVIPKTNGITPASSMVACWRKASSSASVTTTWPILELVLRQAPGGAGKLVVADAVFSMDGDILDLPTTVALCQKYGARLMIDEAHSLGVLGKTGHGIEEHYDMPGAIAIKMGTLSKTIPGIGGSYRR